MLRQELNSALKMLMIMPRAEFSTANAHAHEKS
jgi:hypothetical protein